MTSRHTASRRQRPTMTDVAKAAGVSQSTVSMVLNNVPGARLSADTRARVLSTALSLGYRLPHRPMLTAPGSPDAQAAPLAPTAIIRATIFGAIDFIVEFLQIKKSPIRVFGQN